MSRKRRGCERAEVERDVHIGAPAIGTLRLVAQHRKRVAQRRRCAEIELGHRGSHATASGIPFHFDYRAIDRRVAGAAAQIAGQRDFHLVERRRSARARPPP